jgi:hypothetical protein
MTSILDNPITRQNPGRSVTHDASRPTARVNPAKAPSKAIVRTLLVASCGWPTDAPAPERKKLARR